MLKIFRISIILFVTVIVSSCEGQSQNINKEISGIWNSVGHSQQLQISKKKVTVYDTYESGCNVNSTLPTKFLSEIFDINTITKDSLQLQFGFTKYNFEKVPTTKRCNKVKNKKDALVNFDALWETFNENYAFFELRIADWDSLKVTYRNRLSKITNDKELYAVLNEMISTLKDGHSSIDIPDALEDDIKEEDDDANDILRHQVIQKINQNYVNNLKQYNTGLISWGFINDSTSYLQFNDFEDLADYDIPDNLPIAAFTEQYWEFADESKDYAEDVLNGSRSQMQVIFDDIKSTKACIIYVRFNGGGYDQIGMEILGYFTEEKTLAFSKKVRYKNGFAQPQAFHLIPNKQHYKGDVYILTSHQTASASETFMLASQNIEKITRIGSNTVGILSDVLSKRLPNGWEYGLSNEVYESVEGISYEKVGIPPDHKLKYAKDAKIFYSNLLHVLDKKDEAIEKAIELIKSKKHQ